MSSGEQTSLSLPSIVQRFEESTATLTELSDRLRALSTQENARAELVEALRSSAEQMADTAGDLGAASTGIVQLAGELGSAAELARQNMEATNPDLVMKAIVHQGVRIDQVEKQLAALASSLVTLAAGLNQHFVDAEERSARSAAELDALIARVMAMPEKTRRKHGFAWPDDIKAKRTSGDFVVIDRRKK